MWVGGSEAINMRGKKREVRQTHSKQRVAERPWQHPFEGHLCTAPLLPTPNADTHTVLLPPMPLRIPMQRPSPPKRPPKSPCKDALPQSPRHSRDGPTPRHRSHTEGRGARGALAVGLRTRGVPVNDWFCDGRLSKQWIACDINIIIIALSYCHGITAIDTAP